MVREKIILHRCGAYPPLPHAHPTPLPGLLTTYQRHCRHNGQQTLTPPWSRPIFSSSSAWSLWSSYLAPTPANQASEEGTKAPPPPQRRLRPKKRSPAKPSLKMRKNETIVYGGICAALRRLIALTSRRRNSSSWPQWTDTLVSSRLKSDWSKIFQSVYRRKYATSTSSRAAQVSGRWGRGVA